jgi:hypothetical protein
LLLFYPLVLSNIAIEHGHRNSEFSHKKWWFSIVFCMFTGSPKRRSPSFHGTWSTLHPRSPRVPCAVAAPGLWPRRSSGPESSESWVSSLHYTLKISHDQIMRNILYTHTQTWKNKTRPMILMSQKIMVRCIAGAPNALTSCCIRTGTVLQ